MNLPTAPGRQRTIRALILTHVIAGVGLSQIELGPGPSSLVMVYLATVISQSALLGLWLGIGRTPLIRRGALAVLALSAMVALLFVAELRQGKTNYLEVVIVAMVVTIEVATLALASLVLRRTGWRIGLESESPPSADESARMQFSLVDMFLFTTMVALVLGALAGVRQLVSYFELPEIIDLVALLAVASAAITFCAAWAALSRRNYAWRILALPVVALTIVAAYFLQGDWYLPKILAIHAAITFVTLFVLRNVGYRLFLTNRHRSIESEIANDNS